MTGKIFWNDVVNITVLQTIIKLVKLLTIASLTSVVMHTIRNELVFDDDLFFKIISGVFMFSFLKYLWSSKLWGSFRGKISLSTKIHVYEIVIFSSLIAVTIDFSIAILIIPKYQDWHAVDSEIYICDSIDDAWSILLKHFLTGLKSFCLFFNAIDYFVCPNGGYKDRLSEKSSMFQIYNKNRIQMNVSKYLIWRTRLL